MPYREVMGLPLRVFWQLSGYVDRLRADEARLGFEMSLSTGNAEQAAQMREHLDYLAPAPIKTSIEHMIETSSVRDTAGFEELRSLAG